MKLLIDWLIDWLIDINLSSWSLSIKSIKKMNRDNIPLNALIVDTKRE